ncbi:MAG: hypothetical protein JW801_14805 [Bacteroidales bacterium]|nr:hypothetical protein [Bacteroidales bacterium]
MSEISLDHVMNSLKRKSYKIFKSDVKPYNLNIVGIRSNTTIPNSFDDFITVFWKFKGCWSFIVYQATTDPGLYWLQHPMNPLGTAVMKPGQYPGSYKVGIHRGYKALEQIGDITVIRDYIIDDAIHYDSGREETGIFSINIHRAKLNGRSINVDKWSAGCQVFADSAEFSQFIAMCEESATHWGNSFTYTLIEESDLG